MLLPMDKAEQRSARRMHDQHSQEEAGLRRAQQLAAGDSHHPIQDVPHGEQPVVRQGFDVLRRDYEDALRKEADAWSRVQGVPGEDGFDAEAWEDWRDAVEARDRATRLLVNHAMDVRTGFDRPGPAG